MIFSGLFTSITCKLRIDELSYCKSIFLEVMTVKKTRFYWQKHFSRFYLDRPG